jgi:hypothetical protein
MIKELPVGYCVRWATQEREHPADIAVAGWSSERKLGLRAADGAVCDGGVLEKMSGWLFDWWLHRIVLGTMAIAFFVMAGVFARYIFVGKYKPPSVGFFVVSTIIAVIGGLGAVWLMLMDNGIR